MIDRPVYFSEVRNPVLPRKLSTFALPDWGDDGLNVIIEKDIILPDAIDDQIVRFSKANCWMMLHVYPEGLIEINIQPTWVVKMFFGLQRERVRSGISRKYTSSQHYFISDFGSSIRVENTPQYVACCLFILYQVLEDLFNQKSTSISRILGSKEIEKFRREYVPEKMKQELSTYFGPDFLRQLGSSN